ncbi:MAG TPA: aspartate aminotransferase family protein [Bryobacteraceae bacterium]|nr:aspartate aminotransferase family protein [Bryobacteraceae bacterium]
MSLAASAPATEELYSDHVNPQWVKLLNLLRMNVRYERCTGSELITSDGRCILDFLSGYCVHNAGHNHPDILEALKAELDRRGPGMLQSHVPELAGELAAALCKRAGGRLQKAFFSSSGSEGVEAAIKFSRAHTKRTGLLYAHGAFHGLTCGALSVMGDSFWRESFGPMLSDTESVPFGSIDELERQLATRKFAALILEPVQGEAGIRIAPSGYLEAAQALCRRHGTLFVLDEVQTGMYRTGKFLASHYYDVEPDMVVLAKALSGGVVPVSALLMSDAVYKSVYGSLKRSIVHTSTFSENSLSMRAGLASLEVLEREQLGQRAIESGEYLRSELITALSTYEMVKEVRGLGLLSGIEFSAPKKLTLRLPFEAFMRIHPSMFGQVIVMRLFRDAGVLTQICGNDFLTLKAAPPLVVERPQLDRFIQGVKEVVELMHTSTSFWSEALGLAQRVIANI